MSFVGASNAMINHINFSLADYFQRFFLVVGNLFRARQLFPQYFFFLTIASTDKYIPAGLNNLECYFNACNKICFFRSCKPFTWKRNRFLVNMNWWIINEIPQWNRIQIEILQIELYRKKAVFLFLILSSLASFKLPLLLWLRIEHEEQLRWQLKVKIKN